MDDNWLEPEDETQTTGGGSVYEAANFEPELHDKDCLEVSSAAGDLLGCFGALLPNETFR